MQPALCGLHFFVCVLSKSDHAENQSEQRNGFAKTYNSYVLGETLAGFGKSVCACGACLALYKSGNCHCQTGGDTKTEKEGRVSARGFHLLHKQETINGLSKRSTCKNRENKGRGLVTHVALFPCADSCLTCDAYTESGTYCSNTHCQSCS